MRGSRGVGTLGSGPPSPVLEKHKAVNFLRNTGLEPLEKQKRFAGGPMVARFGCWV